MKPAISVDQLHRRLLRVEQRKSEADMTPERIRKALRHTIDTGELPGGPPDLRDLCRRWIGSLAAIEHVQVGTTREDWERARWGEVKSAQWEE